MSSEVSEVTDDDSGAESEASSVSEPAAAASAEESAPDQRKLERAPFADAFAARDAALATLLQRPEALSLRGMSPLGEPREEGFGPDPSTPRIAWLQRGRADVSLVSYPIARGDKPAAIRVRAVELDVRALDWGKHGKAFARAAGRVLLAPEEGEPLIVAECIGEDEVAAREELSPFASELEAFLGLAAVPDEQAAAARADAPNSDGALSVVQASRFATRFEGDHWVLRDLESIGPRARAPRYRVIAGVSLVLAAIAWVGFAREVLGAREMNTLLGLGVLGVVLSLAAFAMNEIARYALKYEATSEPLAWFSDDRVVVAPWVSRTGAIDTRPEGRLGAAIRIAEVTRVIVESRPTGGDADLAVTLESEHGPIEVLVTRDRQVAEHWAEAIRRSLEAVASPEKKKTALMRARARQKPAPA